MEGGSVGSVSSLHSLSSARSTPVPATFKALTPSASLLALTNKPEEELRQKSNDQLLNIIHRFENEYRSLMSEHGNIIKDVNKKLQILLIETKGLKEINQSLQDDNQELRDLCCFLDDDRQRGRKLAREWQRFGRYTASVMRSEVSVYQEKLKELEQKQQELINDNIELKELCLYLDQERLRLSNQTRDEGDGSSSSTLAGNDDHPQSDGIDLIPVSQLHPSADARDSNEYIQQLEEKVRQLEGSKGSTSELPGARRLGPDGVHSPETVGKGTSLNKPEAVVHAMKVLEVHENLERPAVAVGEDNLDDKEKAIVREMCNVVWRKLGNVSAEQNATDSESSTPHPVYENLQPATNGSGPSVGPGSINPSRSAIPAPSSSVNGPAMSSSMGDRSLGYLSQDGLRVDYHHPSYGQPDNYRARSASPGPQPPPYDKRSPPAYPGRSVNASNVNNMSHSGQYNGNKPLNSGQSSQDNLPPKYGYVRMTRSTPVTPTPSQQSETYSLPPPSASSTPSSKPQAARSRSPGPKPVTQHPDVPRSHSPDPYLSKQPSSSDMYNVYQNHPPAQGSKRDNSYENIPVGPIFTSTPSSVSGHNSLQQYKANTSLNQSLDFSGQGNQYLNPNQGNYAYSGPPQRDVPPSPALYRNNHQSVSDYRQARLSQAYYDQGPSNLYKKVQDQLQFTNTNSTAPPSGATYNSQQRPLPPYPSQPTSNSSSSSYSKGGTQQNYPERSNQPSLKPGNQQAMYRQEAGYQYKDRQTEGGNYNYSRPEPATQQYSNRPDTGNQSSQGRQYAGNQQANNRQDYSGNQVYSNKQDPGNRPRQNAGDQMYQQQPSSRDQFYRN